MVFAVVHRASPDRDGVAIRKGNLETFVACAECHMYMVSELGSSVNNSNRKSGKSREFFVVVIPF